jgi:hypothetical protein
MVAFDRAAFYPPTERNAPYTGMPCTISSNLNHILRCNGRDGRSSKCTQLSVNQKGLSPFSLPPPLTPSYLPTYISLHLSKESCNVKLCYRENNSMLINCYHVSARCCISNCRINNSFLPNVLCENSDIYIPDCRGNGKSSGRQSGILITPPAIYVVSISLCVYIYSNISFSLLSFYARLPPLLIYASFAVG